MRVAGVKIGENRLTGGAAAGDERQSRNYHPVMVIPLGATS
jgi:hypothetical protein